MDIKNSIIKQGSIQLILAAFLGGMLLSILELYSMLQNKEHIDSYFLGGMVIAGFIGIVGYILSNPDNARAAILAGVSAPQLLGGLKNAAVASSEATMSFLKTAPLYASMFIGLLFPSAHAKPVVVPDSISVIISVYGSEYITIKTIDSIFVVSGIAKLEIKKQDSIIVAVPGIDPSTIYFYETSDTGGVKIDKNKKEFVIKISVDEVQVQQKSKSGSFFRGMFAQQQRVDPVIKKIDIKVE